MFDETQVDASIGYILAEPDTADDDADGTRRDNQNLSKSVHS